MILKIKAEVIIEVQSNLKDPEQIKSELEQESLYNIESTENVLVLQTEWAHSEILTD